MNTILVNVLGFCFLLVVFQVWSHPCFCFWAKIHIHDIIQSPHLCQWIWNNFSFAFYRPPTKLWKVMFPVECVCLFTEVISLDLTIQGPPLVTATAPLPLDTPYSVQGPLAPPWPDPPAIDIWWSKLDTCLHLVPWETLIVLTSGGQDWRPAPTCSHEYYPW